MSDKPSNSQPQQPPLPVPPEDLVRDPIADVLGGEGIRGEVAGCPTGLSSQRPRTRPPRQPQNTPGVEPPPPTGSDAKP